MIAKFMDIVIAVFMFYATIFAIGCSAIFHYMRKRNDH